MVGLLTVIWPSKGGFTPKSLYSLLASPLRGRLHSGRLPLTIDVLASQSLDYCPELYLTIVLCNFLGGGLRFEDQDKDAKLTYLSALYFSSRSHLPTVFKQLLLVETLSG